MSATHTPSTFTSQRNHRYGELRTRWLPICSATGLPCFDERHQAKDAAKAIRQSGDPYAAVNVVRCESGRHYHLQVEDRLLSRSDSGPSAPMSTAGDRRLVVLDSECATHGAHGTDETPLAEFMSVLTGEAITLTPADRIVVGASRVVARKLRPAVIGPNVEWVIGRDEKDGADRALLDWARLNLRSLAADFDELVIVSGDHCFERLARRWIKYGPSKRVHVVTTDHPDGRSSLARSLSTVAHRRTRIRMTVRTKQAEPWVDTRSHRRVHADNPVQFAA